MSTHEGNGAKEEATAYGGGLSARMAYPKMPHNGRAYLLLGRAGGIEPDGLTDGSSRLLSHSAAQAQDRKRGECLIVHFTACLSRILRVVP